MSCSDGNTAPVVRCLSSGARHAVGEGIPGDASFGRNFRGVFDASADNVVLMQAKLLVEFIKDSSEF